MDEVDRVHKIFTRERIRTILEMVDEIQVRCVELRQLLLLMGKEGEDTPPPARTRARGLPDAPGGPE